MQNSDFELKVRSLPQKTSPLTIARSITTDKSHVSWITSVHRIVNQSISLGEIFRFDSMRMYIFTLYLLYINTYICIQLFAIYFYTVHIHAGVSLSSILCFIAWPPMGSVGCCAHRRLRWKVNSAVSWFDPGRGPLEVEGHGAPIRRIPHLFIDFRPFMSGPHLPPFVKIRFGAHLVTKPVRYLPKPPADTWDSVGRAAHNENGPRKK